MKKLLPALLLVSISIPSHAGLWDSITGMFGGSDDSEAVPVETANVENAPVEQAQVESAAAEASTTASAMGGSAMQLLPMLTQSLGVNTAQATGGVGALLMAAKNLLGGDFSKIASAIPNADSLLAAAPKLAEAASGKGGSLMDSAMSAAGEASPTAKAGSQLLSQFKSLGLGADMIPQFGDVTSKFLQQGGNEEASNLLSGALGKLL